MGSRLSLSKKDLYVLGGAFALGAIVAIFWFRSTFLAARDSSATQQISIEVKQNENLMTVAKQLEEKGVVNSWWAIYYLNSFQGKQDFKLLVGEYLFSPSQTPKQILEDLREGKVHYNKLTIPPGSRVTDIAKLMAETKLVTEEEANAAFNDKNLMFELKIPASTFEGYLFPETYNVTKPDDAPAIIRRMVQEGRKQLQEKIPGALERALELNLAPHQVLTLASIIEKESARPEERPIISSVFHNRLRIGMPLQSDPTVIYGIPNFNGNLTKDDLKIATPYNTYLQLGLPPTPICSPSLDSIKAALYPQDTDYLYFVSKGDGTHQFSSSYSEHRKAVKMYQQGGNSAAPDAVQ